MATATTTTTPPVFLDSPFSHPDLGEVVSQSFEVQDIAHCALVSKAWGQAMNEPGVWLTMFDNEKFPRIANRTATAKEDFRFMRRITVSKRDAACLGGFVGEVPVLSEKILKWLKYGRDAFDPTKYNDETHVVIVKPSHFLIPYDHVLSVAVDAKNATDQKEMMIPYSDLNVLILAENAWKGEETLLGEATLSNLDVILDQCDKVSTTVDVYIMRVISPEQTEQMKYPLQKQYLEKKGYEVAPFGHRLYLNMLQLFNKGACPDKDVSSSTSDLVRVIDHEALERTGEELFDDFTVSIGDYNREPESVFPCIQPWPTDAYREEMRAAAGFPAELAVMKETPAGSKRTHDEAFGAEA